MKHGLKSLALVALIGSSAAFAGGHGKSAAALIEEATAGYKQVSKETTYQWTTTVKVIKAAQKALDGGNEAEAKKLAQQALDLVEATRQQAQVESENWKMRVPK